VATVAAVATSMARRMSSTNDPVAVDVQGLLKAWAQWRFSSGLHIGFPRRAAFVRDARMPGRATVRVPDIPDEYAQRIDLAVSQLKLRSEPVPGDHRWQVLTDSYLAGWSDGVIARKRRLGRESVRVTRIAAENWIEARIT